MIDKEIQESEEKARRLEEESVLKTFWSESENIVMKAPSGHKLKDIARYEVRVKENTVPEGDLQELDAEKKVFACTILKGLDWLRFARFCRWSSNCFKNFAPIFFPPNSVSFWGKSKKLTGHKHGFSLQMKLKKRKTLIQHFLKDLEGHMQPIWQK